MSVKPELPAGSLSTPLSWRLLTAARLLGACVLSAVAQVAVDMPEGYFGAADSVTRWGVGYTLLLGFLALLVLLSLLGRGQRGVAVMITALNVGAFALAMAADPLVSGLVVGWNLTVLAQVLVPGSRGEAEPEDAEEPLTRWLHHWGAAVQHLSFVFLMLAIGVEGYRLTDEPLARGLVLGLGVLTLALALPFLILKIRAGSRVALLVLVPLAVAALFVTRPATSIALLALTVVLLLALLTAQRRTTAEVLQLFLDYPSRLVAISFVSVILVGAVLLTFPAASASGVPISPLDALFTSASATCVTGLVVVDTPTAFSPLGHVILLALIQIGGLGIMVLSTFATLIMGGTLGLRGARALKEMLQIDAERGALRLVRFIVLATVSLEAVGALLLTLAFDDLGLGPVEALWRGVFHSVSAFCNAGFALQSDSLVQLQSNPLAVLTVAALITVGGLGFSVLAALWTLLRSWPGRERVRLDLQSKTVLVASAVLVIVGWGLFAGFEWHGSLEGLSGMDKALNALFQSVTLRTAGFNTVTFDEVLPVSSLFMMVWMFIGASPGGTGGGLKTTTLVVLLAAVVALGRGSTSVNLFDREVPREIVYRGLAVFVLSSVVTLGALLLLLLLESQSFEALAFETVSAVGTVGLSLGATPKLGAAGKLVIIGAMFIGRIGPLTLVLFLGRGGARRRTYRYPQSRLMVG